MDGMRYFASQITVTITTHAIQHHFLIWMTTVRQPAKRRCSCVLTLKYTFICVYWWTRQRIHNTLIWVDRYLRRMGDKTIPDSAEPRLESLYPPFVAGIDLPHQGVVDCYNLFHWYYYGGSHVGSHFSHQTIWPLNSCCPQKAVAWLPIRPMKWICYGIRLFPSWPSDNLWLKILLLEGNFLLRRAIGPMGFIKPCLLRKTSGDFNYEYRTSFNKRIID